MERILISRLINADADAVWTIVRDFNGLPDWHPAIVDSTIEDARPADAVGCVRSFHLADGSHLREQLTELSDTDRRMRYVILESPLLITDYAASIEIVPVTENNASVVVWQAAFEAAPADAPSMVETVADSVFRAGLAELADHFG